MNGKIESLIINAALLLAVVAIVGPVVAYFAGVTNPLFI